MHNFSETDKLAYMGEVDDGELPGAARLLQQALLLFLCWHGTLTSPVHCTNPSVFGFR